MTHRHGFEHSAEAKKEIGKSGICKPEDVWQYIMLAVAIFIAVIFCCYYIITQSRWGFYSTGRNGVRTAVQETLPESSAAGDDDVSDGSGKPEENDAGDESGMAETGDTENEDGMAQEDGAGKVKRAYLTFDDGPSGQTGEILDILDTYGVKATFFVVGRGENYYGAYRDIVSRGHTLGIHSFSHDYDKVYASVSNFAEDVEELRKLLYDVTGVNCVYYRFPGGSSNTVSKTDMSELIEYINSCGMTYFDWNSLNGDAVSGSYTPQELVDNIMKDAVCYDDVIILMHDLEERHTTVESLPLLIETLRESGYELLAIDEDTPLMQHRKN